MKAKQYHHVADTRKLLLLMASVLYTQLLKSQDSISFRHVTYKVIVGTSTDNRTSLGYLSSISDTSVFISSLPVKFNGYANLNSKLKGISYNEIYDLRLRRKGSTVRGLLIGAIAGAAVGALLGAASGDDSQKNQNSWCIPCFTAGEKAQMGGFALGSIGALIGAIIGKSTHKTFTIKNNKESFNEFRWQLIH
jgi:hypothetical protein